jgi:formaldehyde-activating enzyme involved in methanogenesis
VHPTLPAIPAIMTVAVGASDPPLQQAFANTGGQQLGQIPVVVVTKLPLFL